MLVGWWTYAETIEGPIGVGTGGLVWWGPHWPVDLLVPGRWAGGVPDLLDPGYWPIEAAQKGDL